MIPKNLPRCIAPPECFVCGRGSPSRICCGCGVVYYCSSKHRSDHRPVHESACSTVKELQEAFDREEAEYEDSIEFSLDGTFRSPPDKRAYLRARFVLAKAILRINTPDAVTKALSHFAIMMRIDRGDPFGAADYIPPLLLRLDREQECYNFLKWWAIRNDAGNDDRGGYGHGPRFPLEYPPADAFEPLSRMRPRGLTTLSLSQLVSLTLLKLRLRIDLGHFRGVELELESYEAPRRHVGKLLRARIWCLDVEKAFWALDDQYCQLYRMVHSLNPHFWELIDDKYELPQGWYERAATDQCARGSMNEALLVLHHCKSAWDESEFAMRLLVVDNIGFELFDQIGTAYIDFTIAGRRKQHAGAWDLAKKRGVGKAFPKVFDATPTLRPDDVFLPTSIPRDQVRFACRTDLNKVLVYTDGACANNGQSGAQAGWAVVYGPTYDKGLDSPRTALGRLEDQGPFGDESVHTSNRAELRAVIGALRLSDWRDEGFESIVIATDSTYVVNGATDWALDWVRCDWKTRTGKEVKNRDLWELLLGEVERWSERGLRVELWKIPRDWNKEADEAAKHACRVEERRERFRDIFAYS